MSRTPKRPDRARTVTTYAKLDEYVQDFVSGHLSLLIIVGGSGLQKSTNLRDAFAPDTCCWIETNTTPFGMYCKLWHDRGKPVVINDVDDLYANRTAMRLLKSLCETGPVKTVYWQTAATLGHRGIPGQFTTTSRVAIVANEWKTLNANVQAVEDRGHVVFFEPTALEVHLRVAAWFPRCHQDIFDFIGQHLHLIERPSMRHYERAAERKAAGRDWREDLLLRWGLSDYVLEVARLLADLSYANDHERAKAFAQKTGRSVATFYNLRKKLGRPVEVPKIVLKHEPPKPPEQAVDLIGRLREQLGRLGNG